MSPVKHRFQRYLVRTEILSIFHVRVEYISVQKIRHSAHSNQRLLKCRKIPKEPLPLGLRGPSSNTPISPPTPFTIPNGIRIQSAVLPQYTSRTDRQTQTHTRTGRRARRQVSKISAYARYTDRDRRANNNKHICIAPWGLDFRGADGLIPFSLPFPSDYSASHFHPFIVLFQMPS